MFNVYNSIGKPRKRMRIKQEQKWIDEDINCEANRTEAAHDGSFAVGGRSKWAVMVGQPAAKLPARCRVGLRLGTTCNRHPVHELREPSGSDDEQGPFILEHKTEK